jgi:hypothetical protein
LLNNEIATLVFPFEFFPTAIKILKGHNKIQSFSGGMSEEKKTLSAGERAQIVEELNRDKGNA